MSIGVGIIGTGFGAAVQLPGFLRIPDARVLGIASKKRERSEEFALKHNLPRVFDSYEGMIQSKEIDLVSIATSPLEHAKLVRSALDVGKHVLCEKPFTFHASAAERLLQLAEAKDVIHGIDFEFRELPAMKLLSERLDSEAIGKIVSAKLQWTVGSWADPKRLWQWQNDASLGGGVLGALGVHLFDAAEWFLGSMHSLHAITEIKIKERPGDDGAMKPVTSEDTVTIDMKSGSGLPVHIALSHVDPNGNGLRIEIVGDKGVLILDSTSKEHGKGLRVREGKDRDNLGVLYHDDSEPTIDARIPPFQSLAERLVKAIQEKDRAFRPSFIEGVRSDMFLEGVKESNTTRDWISL